LLDANKTLEVENQKIKDALFDWEKAIQTMISDREREKQEMDSQMKHISKIHQSLTLEKNNALTENSQLNTKLEACLLENQNLKKICILLI
jgi:ribosomal protein S20